MKHSLIYTLWLALTLMGFCTNFAWAGDGDVRVTRQQKVAAFYAIDITAVGEIYFTQGDSYSLTIEGKEKQVNNITANVSGGMLAIGFKDKRKICDNNDGVTIRLTAPGLDEIIFRGVGSFYCGEALQLDGDLRIDVQGVGEVNMDDLHCRNLRLTLQGVGNATVKVDCDYVDASLSGMGNVTLKGRAKDADLHRGGWGNLDTGGLKIGED